MAPSKRRSAPIDGADFADVLTSIFELMLMSGAGKKSILETATHALQRANESQIEQPSKRQAGLVMAALVLDAWHRNRRYLDAEARPKEIALLGPAPSVEALIRAERPSQDAASVARRMRSLRLVIRARKDLYRPADRIAVISKLNPLVHQHVARSFSNLLKTIKYNVTRRGSSHRLIERIAEVPDLPSGCRQEFQKFAQIHGWAFLKTMNDWLELRRARRSSKRSARTLKAGVHLYAYTDSGNNREKSRR